MLTIRSLIKVDSKIYRLTAVHEILDPLRFAKNTSSLVFDSPDSAASAASDSKSESGDDSDTSFDTSCLDEQSLLKRLLWEYDYLGQTARAAFRGQFQYR
jgi:hypothetical protein